MLGFTLNVGAKFEIYETFVATFRYDPAVVTVAMVGPDSISSEIDSEAGTVTFRDENNVFARTESYAFQFLCVGTEVGDAKITLESFKVNDEEILSQSIAAVQTIGYNITWTEDVAYTITGEKFAGYGVDYDFTVEVNDGYDGSNMVVKANGEELGTGVGSYSIPSVESDQTITVEGVTEAVKETLVDFDVTPADAKVTVWDNSKNKVEPNEDGKYVVTPGTEYTYLVQKDGYVSQKNTFKLDESSTVVVTLTEASENPNLDRNITAEWGNFRNGDNNLGITDAKTPYAPEDAELLWAVKYGTGWAAAPGSPILVDGDIYTYSGSTIRRINSMTGEVVTEGTMVGQSSFSIVPMTYGDGMVFVGLSGGRIQAFNAKTLESLWVYTDDLGGQPNCPITYKDGYIYAGFWNSETKDANFACINTVDEDHASTTEAKYATWTYTRQGGFYWAGAYVTDKLAIVGTDDGAGGYNTNGAALLVFDRYTGEKLDSHEGIRGDLRSNVSHDPESDRVFFTTKGGILGNAQIDWETGKILDYKEVVIVNSKGTANAMSTCTPSVYNGRIYIGVAGNSQFGASSGHGIAVYDLNSDGSMTQAYVYDIVGYPQTSAMVSTAYSAEDGSVYIYLPYNYTPGGVSVLKDKPGQTAPVTTTGTGYSEVFTPVGTLAQYCICSTIADQYGTIYYKNDSCYMMAITSKIESLEITQEPTITENEDGTITVDGLKAVTKLKNGEERDVSNYVSVVKNEQTGGYTVSYTYGFDDANYGLKTLSVDLVDYTVTIPENAGYTITGKTAVKNGEDYTFTVTVNEGYDATNMVVKVNGEEVTPVDGVYTVEKVSANLEITVEGVTKNVAYTVNFEGMSGAGDNVALGAAFEGVFSVTADSAVSYETFAASFKFDPAVVAVTYVRPAIFEQSVDSETGTLTLTSKNGSFPANAKGEIMIGFKTVAFGDATVSLTSVRADDKEVLSESITVAKAAGYKVTWDKNANFQVAGEKYANVGGKYQFAIAAKTGYDVSNVVVKVNGKEVTAVDDLYTVENVSSDLEITVEGVQKAAVYTVGFAKPSGEADLLAKGDVHSGVVTITADRAAFYKSLEITFMYNPATCSFEKVSDGFTANVDAANGTVTVTAENGSFTAGANDVTVSFLATGYGDASILLTSVKIDGKKLVSEEDNLWIEKSVGYSVTWTEDAAYTVTGEKVVAPNADYTFTVAANKGYDASNAVVKVNDEVVAAVDGKYTVEKVSSDLTITVEGVVKAAVNGLSALRFGTTGTISSAKYFDMTPSFDPAVKEYTLLVPDTTNGIYAWATRGADLTTKASIKATWTSMSTGKASNTTLTSGTSSGKNLSGFNIASAESNTLTITVTDNGSTDVYTIKTVRIDPSLTKLALDGVKINETFSATKKAYTAITTKDSVTVLATPRSESYTVTYNGGTSNVIPLSAGDNTIEIVVTNKDGYTNSYTLTVTKADHNVTIPTDESYLVTGKEAVIDGADYTFKVEVDYRYEATEDFAVKVNGETVTGEKGVYTVKNVTTDLVITVEGVTKKILEPVTVYFSFSHDDKFEFCDQSGETMALKEVTVPYFDLGLYGLEDFYFSSEDYGPASGDPTGGPGSALEPGTKEFAYGKVTMFHLFIYATEVYYLGVDPADAGKGYLKDNGLGTSIFNVTGSTGSTFLQEIWNYDLNLNYYLNYEYPLASKGWGSTSDQILLHDGDIVTLGHFTDWSFFNDTTSIFNYIAADKTDAVQGDEIRLELYHAGNGMGGDYSTAHTLIDYCPDVYCVPVDGIISGDVTEWTKVGTAESDGSLVVDTSNLAPGEYIFALAGQPGKENPDAICSTPGGVRVTIHEKPIAKGDLNGDGVVDVFDVSALYSAIFSDEELDAAVADVNGDGVVDVFDVSALYALIMGNN